MISVYKYCQIKAAVIRALGREGVSVGWDDVAANEEGEWVPVRALGRAVSAEEVRYDLLDVSAVPVPGDPGALMGRGRAGLQRLRGMLEETLGEGDELGQVGAETAEAVITNEGRGAGPADSETGVGGVIERLHRVFFPEGVGS